MSKPRPQKALYLFFVFLLCYCESKIGTGKGQAHIHTCTQVHAHTHTNARTNIELILRNMSSYKLHPENKDQWIQQLERGDRLIIRARLCTNVTSRVYLLSVYGNDVCTHVSQEKMSISRNHILTEF